MRERPILFSAPMVRALLNGNKTQTRRVAKPQPRADQIMPREWGAVMKHNPHAIYGDGLGWNAIDESGKDHEFRCPYGQPGDRLWVREAWARIRVLGVDLDWIVYRTADNRTDYGGPWKPGIHMFRKDSRIDLEITGVRVERLQDISEADARAEGAPPSHPSIDRISREFGYSDFSRSWYAQLWEQINGAGSWAANPWVWVVEFRTVKP